jgi:hypothetical protein
MENWAELKLELSPTGDRAMLFLWKEQAPPVFKNLEGQF